MTNPIRLGIVGCGSVMSRPYMSIIRTLESRGLVEIRAACDIRADKQAFVQEQLGIPKFTTDYQEIVTNDEIDLVMVLTSMPEHGPITRAALNNGKHVLVEKPMSIDLDEAAELVALAQDSPGHLLCAPHVILSPTYQAMWKHLARGDIGEVRLARARYGHAGPNWGKWYYQPGGGPLFDLGVYNVTSLTGFLGPVQRVTAMVGTAIPERFVDGEQIQVQTEDNFQILLDFGDACFAVVTTGFSMQQYRSPAIELYGTQGTLQMHGDDWAPEGYDLWQNREGAWKVFDDRAPNWPWTDGLRHLVECIAQGTSPIITPEHAYHVLEVMIRATEAGRDGQARDIQSRFTPPRFDDDQEGTNARHLVHDRTHE